MLSRLGRIKHYLKGTINKYKFSEKVNLAVIGGGSGGLACIKKFNELSKEYGLENE